MDRVFEPRGGRGNAAGMVREIARELAQARWLTWQLLKRDLLVGHKQYLGGILWSCVVPLLGLILLLVLQRSGVFSSGEMNVPYPLYALCGMALWQFFAMGTLAAANSLVQASGLLSRVDFCRKALVLSSIGQTFIPFFLQLLVLSVLMALSGMAAGGLAPFLVLSLPLVFLALGAGFFLSIVNVVFRDAGQAAAIGVNLFLLITPVVYAVPRTGILARLSRYNPFFYLIQAPRDMLFARETALWAGYWVSLAFALCVFFAGLVFFHLAERTITERI